MLPQNTRKEAKAEKQAHSILLRAMSPSTMPFGPELTAEGLRTLSPSTLLRTVSLSNGFSKGSVEWQASFSSFPLHALRACALSHLRWLFWFVGRP